LEIRDEEDCASGLVGAWRGVVSLEAACVLETDGGNNHGGTRREHESGGEHGERLTRARMAGCV
jgi:hypothetical protein